MYRESWDHEMMGLMNDKDLKSFLGFIFILFWSSYCVPNLYNTLSSFSNVLEQFIISNNFKLILKDIKKTIQTSTK